VDPIWDELEDRVEQVFATTEKLREVVGDGKTTRQLLDSIFRNVHSLKASASSQNIDNLARIAHHFENLLHALRTGRANLNDHVLQAFDDTADAMFGCLRQSEPVATSNSQELFNRLESLSAETATGNRLEIEVVLNAVPVEIWQSLSDEEKHRLKQTLGEGAILFLVNTSFDLATFDQSFQDLKTKLTHSGELISTAPKVHDQRSDKIDFRILYTTDLELAQLQKEISTLQDVTIKEVSPPPPPPVASKTSKPEPESRDPQLIRIDLEDLDRLISSTHQLFRDTHACLVQVLASSESTPVSAKVAALDSSFLNLASELVNLRMVPIERVLQRALRAGHSVAAAAGKEVDFEVIGRDLKIDKSLSDVIADPLIHLVRNAVDHGIETSAERAKAGKSGPGKVRIEATTLQGQTRIRVIDDGRGINTELVRQSAERLGLLPETQELNIDQSMRLIFRPGFTTASTISETSGRGVGLDVVETAIEGYGGSIRVNSEPGAGSVFEIRLPVTFSLLNVLIVWVGGYRYLIDGAQVIPITSVEQQKSEAGVRTFRLEKMLGRENLETEQPVLLQCEFDLNSGDQLSIGLHVNQPIVTEQVLVRNLGSHGGRWFGVAGAAEMRDGTVSLLLDIPALVARYRDSLEL
jgi:two-component system chemotaxis sensor kinase CheA